MVEFQCVTKVALTMLTSSVTTQIFTLGMGFEIINEVGKKPKVVYRGYIFTKDMRSTYIYRCIKVYSGCKCKLKITGNTANLDGLHDHLPPARHATNNPFGFGHEDHREII